MKRAITILASAVALLVGCDRSGEGLESSADGVARFSSDISTRVSTDADGVSLWEQGDKIGVYMYSQLTYASNVPYAATSGGATTTTFEAVEDKIIFPTSSNVQFVAYTPYSAELVDDEITIDLSDQTTKAKRNAVDLMVSEQTDEYSYTDSATSIPLVFSHKLAMVRFNVTTVLPVTVAVVSCEITSGVTAIQSYSVRSGEGTATTSTEGAIQMWDENGDGTLFSAILHPETISSAKVLFTTADGDEFTGEIAGEIAADNIYTYSVQVGEGVPEFSISSISSWGSTSSDDLDAEYSLQDIRYDETEGLYKIYTAVGLKAFAGLVNDGTAVTHDAKLMNNIDLSGVCSSGGESWTPIGNSTDEYTGTFDGCGFTISGIYISAISADYQGLFGYVDGGTIENLRVDGYVFGDEYVGGIAGYILSGATVSNCYNLATIKGLLYAGGLVGYVTGSNTAVTDCGNLGSSVTNEEYTGGVVGSAVSGATVINCYNEATLSAYSSGAQWNYLGGVVGYVSASSVINCYNSGSVTGYNLTGGVVGNVVSSSKVENCYNTASVALFSGKSGTYTIGGVVGSADTSSSITYCYWVDVEDDYATAAFGASSVDESFIYEMTAEEMQSTIHLTTLNNIAYLYNQTKTTDAEACAWVAVTNGTPVLDFAATPAIVCDMEYVDGTYMINTAVGLYAFADLVNGVENSVAIVDWGEGEISGFSTTRQTTINGTLTADVNLEGSEDRQWTPIANDLSSNNRYSGKFDGGGYLVSGLYIDDSTAGYQALFGFTGGSSVIQNLGVSGSVLGKECVGGIVAYSYGSVMNCYNAATVTATSQYVGGIVGYSSSYSSIVNCYNTAEVKGSNYAGGIVGSLSGVSVSQISLSNCYNSASVSGETCGASAGYVTYADISSYYWNSQIVADGVGYYNSSTSSMSDYSGLTMIYMQSSEFVTLLNSWVINNAATYPDAAAWIQVVNSFPVFTVSD